MKKTTQCLLLLMTALLLVGCGKPAKPTPTVSAVVTMREKTAHVEITTTNFTMGQQGDGHIHLYLDQIPTPVTLLRPTYDLPNLSPGKHQFKIELTEPNHNPLGIETTVPFEVP